MKTIYTIGHSVHPAAYFLELLQAYHVNCLVDVRSMAASRFNPQYNKPQLEAFLSQNNISYFHLHEEFGARQKDLALLDEIGRVDFDKVRAGAAFQKGISFLRQKAEERTSTVLMCAEADPLSCHRFAMISVALKKDFRVAHILKDKTLLENEMLEEELLKKFAKKLPKLSLFDFIDHDERLQAAYRLLNNQIGYRLG